MKQAGQNFQTKEGQLYLEAFQKGIMPIFGKALDTCSSSMPDTKEPASIVFVVAADGVVIRTFDFTKQFSMSATLAPASGGSALSR